LFKGSQVKSLPKKKSFCGQFFFAFKKLSHGGRPFGGKDFGMVSVYVKNMQWQERKGGEGGVDVVDLAAPGEAS